VVSSPGAGLPAPSRACIDVEETAVVVLVVADYALQVTRRDADVAEDADVGCAAADVVGTAGAANATVVTPAATGRVDPDAAVVAGDVIDGGAQARGEAAAACDPVDRWRAAGDGVLGRRRLAGGGHGRGEACDLDREFGDFLGGLFGCCLDRLSGRCLSGQFGCLGGAGYVALGMLDNAARKAARPGARRGLRGGACGAL
jgi:hypothetical protein